MLPFSLRLVLSLSSLLSLIACSLAKGYLYSIRSYAFWGRPLCWLPFILVIVHNPLLIMLPRIMTPLILRWSLQD
jgi:hypothetical protein